MLCRYVQNMGLISWSADVVTVVLCPCTSVLLPITFCNPLHNDFLTFWLTVTMSSNPTKCATDLPVDNPRLSDTPTV